MRLKSFAVRGLHISLFVSKNISTPNTLIQKVLKMVNCFLNQQPSLCELTEIKVLSLCKKTKEEIMLRKVIIALLFTLSIYLYGTQTITILHTNDHHGRPLAFQCAYFKGAGLPARKTLIDSLRSENANTLVLDAGDINDGLIESSFFDAEPDIIGYNAIGYDAMTLGNHEFYHSLKTLNQQRKLAKFPFLCANITDLTNQPVGIPYIIKTMPNGLRVGIIGLTTCSTQYSASKEMSSALHFNDEVETANSIASQIRDKVDILIALVHMGIATQGNIEEYGSVKLAKNVPALDLVIDGHSHTQLERPLWVHQTDGDSIAVVQALCWGAYLGDANLQVDNGKVKLASWKTIPININDTKIKEDEELKALLMPYKNKADSCMSEVIGTSDKDYTIEQIRLGECELGNFVADASYWYNRDNKVDFAICNSGGIRDALKIGIIKKSDIYNMLPFENNVKVIELNGKQVKEAISYCFSKKVGTGGYLQFSKNIEIIFSKENNNILQIKVNNKAINDNAVYRVSTNSYLSDGGDGYSVLAQAKVINEKDVYERDVVYQYIKEGLKGKVVLHPSNRIIKK